MLDQIEGGSNEDANQSRSLNVLCSNELFISAAIVVGINFGVVLSLERFFPFIGIGQALIKEKRRRVEGWGGLAIPDI